jgi:hypothetical protein
MFSFSIQAIFSLSTSIINIDWKKKYIYIFYLNFVVVVLVANSNFSSINSFFFSNFFLFYYCLLTVKCYLSNSLSYDIIQIDEGKFS